MRAVLQRVTRASVTVEGQVVGSIGPGWLVLLGVAKGDTENDAQWLAEKVAHLRAFEDDQGKMNRSVQEAGGGILVVSQFTLLSRDLHVPAAVPASPKPPSRALPNGSISCVPNGFEDMAWRLPPGPSGP